MLELSIKISVAVMAICQLGTLALCVTHLLRRPTLKAGNQQTHKSPPLGDGGTTKSYAHLFK